MTLRNSAVAAGILALCLVAILAVSVHGEEPFAGGSYQMMSAPLWDYAPSDLDFAPIPESSTTVGYTSEIAFTPEFTTFIPLAGKGYDPQMYFDNFSNPGTGWFIGDEADFKAGYQDGEYEILLRTLGTSLVTLAPIDCVPYGPYSSYSVEADARIYNGTGNSYGLVFGWRDWSFFYSFAVHPGLQRYGVWRWDSSAWTSVLGPISSSHINPDTATNHLRVERTGTQIALYVNGHYLTTITDDVYTGCQMVGLDSDAVSLPSSARFDNFRVRVY